MVVEGKKRFSREEVVRIINTSEDKTQMLQKVQCARTKRQKAEPAPEGAIGLREAARQAGVTLSAVQKWVAKGDLPVVKETRNWVYVSEERVKEIAKNREKRGCQPNIKPQPFLPTSVVK